MSARNPAKAAIRWMMAPVWPEGAPARELGQEGRTDGLQLRLPIPEVRRMSEDRQNELSRCLDETSARWVVDPMDAARVELWWRDKLLARISHGCGVAFASVGYTGAKQDWPLPDEGPAAIAAAIGAAKTWCLAQIGEGHFQRFARYERLLSMESDQASELLRALTDGDGWMLQWVVEDAQKFAGTTEENRELNAAQEEMLVTEHMRAVEAGEVEPMAMAFDADAIAQIENPETRAFLERLNL